MMPFFIKAGAKIDEIIASALIWGGTLTMASSFFQDSDIAELKKLVIGTGSLILGRLWDRK